MFFVRYRGIGRKTLNKWYDKYGLLAVIGDACLMLMSKKTTQTYHNSNCSNYYLYFNHSLSIQKRFKETSKLFLYEIMKKLLLSYIIIIGVSFYSYKLGKEIFNAKIECNKINK